MVRKGYKKRLSRDARREKRQKRVMSWVLVILMVVSMAGIFVSSQSGSKTLEYKNYKFEVTHVPNIEQYVYVIKKDNSGKYFFTLPQDDLTIKTVGNLSKILYPAKYFAVVDVGNDPRVDSFYDQIRYELNIYANKSSILGSINKSSTLPYITCANSTLNVPVFEFNITNNESSIVVNETNGCVKITSRLDDLTLVRDRLLYTATGIINE